MRVSFQQAGDDQYIGSLVLRRELKKERLYNEDTCFIWVSFEQRGGNQRRHELY